MIFDLHNDLLTSALLPNERLSIAQDLQDTVIYALWTTELKRPLSYISEATTAFNTVNCLFAIEDLGFITDAALETLAEMQFAYCGLTHNAANKLAGGALSDADLSTEGRRTIKRLNRANIVIDAAHLNRKSFFSVAEVSQYLIDSHTGLNSLCAHPRNLDDDQVRVVLQHGGIIGLTAVGDFIGGDSVTDYVRLIDCFVQQYGIAGACIGTDFFGTRPLHNLADYKDFSRVAQLLADLGYKHSDIERLFYRNAKNYFKSRRNNL